MKLRRSCNARQWSFAKAEKCTVAKCVSAPSDLGRLPADPNLHPWAGRREHPTAWMQLSGSAYDVQTAALFTNSTPQGREQ